MKKLPILVVLGTILCACTSRVVTGNHPLIDYIETEEYQNEFFSLKYPSDWVYDEEINNMYYSILGMPKGFRCTFYSSDPNHPWHLVMIQKSAMSGMYKTPEEWRDASVQFKQFDDQYIDIVDIYMQDSLRVGTHPAAMAGFIVALESGDTVIHKQTVVMVDNDTYLLNNSYDWHDDGTLELLGDAILSSVRFKNQKKEL